MKIICFYLFYHILIIWLTILSTFSITFNFIDYYIFFWYYIYIFIKRGCKMLKNLYYQIFDRKKFFSSSNDFKEFENYRIGINTSRTNICITLLFPLMLFLYCLSMFFYNTLKINYLYKNPIFFIHIFHSNHIHIYFVSIL